MIRDYIQQENVDCAAYTETWLQPGGRSSQQIRDLTGTGYSFYHKPRASRKGGGIGIMYKSALSIPVISVQSFEHLDVSLKSSDMSVWLVVLY